MGTVRAAPWESPCPWRAGLLTLPCREEQEPRPWPGLWAAGFKVLPLLPACLQGDFSSWLRALLPWQGRVALVDVGITLISFWCSPPSLLLPALCIPRGHFCPLFPWSPKGSCWPGRAL